MLPYVLLKYPNSAGLQCTSFNLTWPSVKHFEISFIIRVKGRGGMIVRLLSILGIPARIIVIIVSAYFKIFK